MKNPNEVKTLSDLSEFINSMGHEDMWPNEAITEICRRNGWIDCSEVDGYRVVDVARNGDWYVYLDGSGIAVESLFPGE